LRPTEADYLAAQAAWPGVEVSREDFEAWVVARSGPNEELHTTELYLCCACVKGDPTALQRFEEAFFTELPRVLSRFGVGVDDILQELRERLFMGTTQGPARLAGYNGRGGLHRWLRAVTVRLALKSTRAKKNQPHVTLGSDEFLVGDDPELAHLQGLYRAEFKKAFGDALAALEPELQTYLRLYYLDGLGLAELAALFQVSAPTVSRRLSKAREEVLEATRVQLRKNLSVSAEELESIMRLIQSKLSVTFGPVEP
jgi:RNA polymerase sigma-70 factor (ECF subfamily)